DSWSSEQRVQIVFVIVIAILGILVAALQKPKTQLARQSSIGLAITISILTTVNQTLCKIDYHTLARKKQAVRTAAEVIRNNLSLYDDGWPEPDRRKLTDEIERRVNTIRDVADEVNPQLIWVLDALSMTSTVHAQSAEPSWLTYPPPDGDSLFAVGQGTGATLIDASRKATEAAAQQLALKAVRRWQRASQSAPVVSPDFARYVAAKMTTVDSHVARDDRSRGFHYDVLVKIAVALVGEKSYVAFAEPLPVQSAQPPAQTAVPTAQARPPARAEPPPVQREVPSTPVSTSPGPSTGGSRTVVESEVRLVQRRKQMLIGREFGGSVSLYAGAPRSSSSGASLRLVVFRTGAEARRWRDGVPIGYEDLLRALSPNQVLANSEVRQGSRVSYVLGGQQYVVEITRVDGAASSQSLTVRIVKE